MPTGRATPFGGEATDRCLDPQPHRGHPRQQRDDQQRRDGDAEGEDERADAERLPSEQVLVTAHVGAGGFEVDGGAALDVNEDGRRTRSEYSSINYSVTSVITSLL